MVKNGSSMPVKKYILILKNDLSDLEKLHSFLDEIRQRLSVSKKCTGSEKSTCRNQTEMMPGRVRAGNERSEPLNETTFRFGSVRMGAIPVLLGNLP
jgi:hypothetical protein